MEGLEQRLSVSVPELAVSDATLVVRVRRGDGLAFETIMRRYNRRLYRLARSLVHDETEAEDVVQEAYVNAFTKLASFAGPESFGAWLSRITINEALGRLRRRARIRPLDDGTGDATLDLDRLLADTGRVEPDPERLVATRELRQMLEQAIDALPPSFRIVFVLRAVEGLSVAEVAAILGIKPETVKTRFHRARAQLRETLDSQIDSALLGAFPFGGPRCDRMVAAVAARIGLRPTFTMAPTLQSETCEPKEE